MNRLKQRLLELWNWLPAFRAIAEAGGLQGASSSIHLSPQALSRSLRLLEQSLGVSLFARNPGGLEPSEDAHRLLHVLRDAMRRIDDALPQQQTAEETFDLVVEDLCALEPTLRGARALGDIEEAASFQALARCIAGGDADMGVMLRPPSEVLDADALEPLVITPLGWMDWSVYAGPGARSLQRVSVPHCMRGRFPLGASDTALAVTVVARRWTWQSLLDAMGNHMGALLPTGLITEGILVSTDLPAVAAPVFGLSRKPTPTTSDALANPPWDVIQRSLAGASAAGRALDRVGSGTGPAPERAHRDQKGVGGRA